MKLPQATRLTFGRSLDNLCQLAKIWTNLFCEAHCNTMEKKTDKRVEALKSTLEELNLQLHLGKADAEKAFEEQKANIRDWAVRMTSRVDEAKNLNEENLTKIRGALEDLRVQASLSKANTEDLSLRLHDYQVKFDIFKLQLQLVKMESDQEFEKRKAEVAKRIS